VELQFEQPREFVRLGFRAGSGDVGRAPTAASAVERRRRLTQISRTDGDDQNFVRYLISEMRKTRM
jgi:hypothetical protein